MQVGLWDHHAVCVTPPTYQLLNVCTNLYGTLYVYRYIWVHVNDVLHKSLPSVWVCIWISISLLGNGSIKRRRRGNEYPRYSRGIFGHMVCCAVRIVSKKTNSVAFSPQANYTDWATTTCRRNLVSSFVDRRGSRGQRAGSPAVVNLSFLDRSRYFSFK
jgi:hypothetical protein